MTEIEILEAAIEHLRDNSLHDAVAVLRKSTKNRCLETAKHLESQVHSPNGLILAGLLQVLQNGLEFERALQRRPAIEVNRKGASGASGGSDGTRISPALGWLIILVNLAIIGAAVYWFQF